MKIIAAILVVFLISSQSEAKLKERLELYGNTFKDFSLQELNDAVKERLNSKAYQILEKFKGKLKNGDEELGIPILDPYEVEQINNTFSFFNGDFKGFASLDDLSFIGLAEYNIEEADFSLLRRSISVTLKWPLLYGNSSYDINAIFQNRSIKVYGAGDFQNTLEELRFETVAYLGLSQGYVYIKSMDTKIDLGNCEFLITGLYNDEGISEAVSTFISIFVQEIVEDYQDDLVELVNSLIMKIGNEYLSDMSLKDLIGLLS